MQCLARVHVRRQARSPVRLTKRRPGPIVVASDHAG